MKHIIAGVAHAINNPSHALMLSLNIFGTVWRDVLPILDAHHQTHPDLTLGGLPYADMRGELGHMLDQAVDNCNRIATILSSLREFAKDVADEEASVIRVEDVIDAALSRSREALDQAGLAVSVTHAEDLDPFLGQPASLTQALANIVDNACKAADSSPAELHITTLCDEARRNITIQLTDAGRGIDAELLPRITDLFSYDRRYGNGPGLGLAIANALISRHGGRLAVSSEPGVGTSVRITLPVTAPEG